MALYMKYGSIKGDATQDEHKEWIVIDSVQFGAGRGISTVTGAARNREASEPSISEVTVMKQMDSSSHEIFKASTTGIKGEDLKLDFTSTDQAGQVFFSLLCSEALVSGYSISSGGERPTESISFNFTKIEYKAAPLGPDNKPTGPFTVTYDIATAKSS